MVGIRYYLLYRSVEKHEYDQLFKKNKRLYRYYIEILIRLWVVSVDKLLSLLITKIVQTSLLYRFIFEYIYACMIHTGTWVRFKNSTNLWNSLLNEQFERGDKFHRAIPLSFVRLTRVRLFRFCPNPFKTRANISSKLLLETTEYFIELLKTFDLSHFVENVVKVVLCQKMNARTIQEIKFLIDYRLVVFASFVRNFLKFVFIIKIILIKDCSSSFY